MEQEELVETEAVEMEPVTIRNMRKRGITVKAALQKLGAKPIIGAFSVIVFFVALMSVMVLMLYSSSKETIMISGELQAAKSASSLEKFILEGNDVVREASYGIEKMLKEDRPHKEIVDYIVELTENIQVSIDDRFTGVYGYIDGEYMDGAMWVPEADYVPTERPWYIKGYAAGGQLVLVEPYLDLETGDLTMTAAKLLNDKESVVALDIKMNMMSEISGEDNEGKIDLVLDSSGAVMAHTDTQEIGKNYRTEKETLGAALYEEVMIVRGGTFDFSYDGTDYLAYSLPIDNQTYSISLIDSNKSYEPLRLLLIFSTLIIVITVVILAVIFINLGLKNLTVSDLNVKLTETTTQTEKAIAESEAKTAFLSNMSHEIRTPINAVLGMNEMILRECQDESILEYAASIKTAGDTLLGLVNDILDFSKIEAQKMEIVPVEYELSSVLNDLVNMVQTRADDKGLELRLDFDSNTPNLLFGDEIRVKQVITNILTNAVKYTEKGSVTFTVKFGEVMGEPDNIMLDVKVSDTGIGIKKEDINKLFNKFDRIEQERNRNIEGTGLGMAITQNLLKAMGSMLHVDSEYGKGSVFRFSLKQKVVSRDPIGDYAESFRKHISDRKEYKEKFIAPDAKVLVVDDTDMNLIVFKSLLKATKMQIDTAADGYAGLKKSRENKYDIIFLDHMMPNKDGIETLSEMRADEADMNHDTPVICLTANAVSGAREFYMNAGFDNYITKPINAEKLEEMVLEYLPSEMIKQGDEIDDYADSASSGASGAGPEVAIVPENSFIMEALADVEEIDAAEGLKNCGSEEDYINILDVFYSTVENRIDEIEGLYNDERWQDYTIKVHALKSTAGIIGAMAFREMAKEIEFAGKEGRIDYIKENHETLIKNYRHIKDKLTPICESGEEEDDTPKEEATPGDVARWFDRLSDAADEMDADEIEEVIDEMKGYALPEDAAEVFDKIVESFERFDYSGIAEAVEEYM